MPRLDDSPSPNRTCARSQSRRSLGAVMGRVVSEMGADIGDGCVALRNELSEQEN